MKQILTIALLLIATTGFTQRNFQRVYNSISKKDRTGMESAKKSTTFIDFSYDRDTEQCTLIINNHDGFMSEVFTSISYIEIRHTDDGVSYKFKAANSDGLPVDVIVHFDKFVAISYVENKYWVFLNLKYDN
jgi:hypothetical protein